MMPLRCACLLALTVLSATATDVVTLWPHGAPDDNRTIPAESNATSGGVLRITNVSVPTITIFPAANASDTVVVVCPGGGYGILAWDLEGTEIAQWLNSLGLHAVILKYRVPFNRDLVIAGERFGPLQDVQRAIGLIRLNSVEYKLGTITTVGVLGFSAGGHLTGLISHHWEKRTYDPIDAADTQSCRPDFAVMIYPAYIVENTGPTLSPEFTTAPSDPSTIPPVFLSQTADDPIHVECSVYYFLHLKTSKVAGCEAHVFPEGGHGYGLRPKGYQCTTWPDRATQWFAGKNITSA